MKIAVAHCTLVFFGFCGFAAAMAFDSWQDEVRSKAIVGIFGSFIGMGIGTLVFLFAKMLVEDPKPPQRKPVQPPPLPPTF
jgi:hypothetical protein